MEACDAVAAERDGSTNIREDTTQPYICRVLLDKEKFAAISKAHHVELKMSHLHPNLRLVVVLNPNYWIVWVLLKADAKKYH